MSLTVRELIREVIAGGLTDPALIAHRVNTLIPDCDVRAALGECLPELARHVISQDRMLSTPTVPAMGGRSLKLEAIRAHSYQERVLAGVYPVPEGSVRVWKRLADMTSAETRAVARGRYEAAAKNTAKADWLMKLADAVDAAGLRVVGDLLSVPGVLV